VFVDDGAARVSNDFKAQFNPQAVFLITTLLPSIWPNIRGGLQRAFGFDEAFGIRVFVDLEDACSTNVLGL
jgi:hypothetical protein